MLFLHNAINHMNQKGPLHLSKVIGMIGLGQGFSTEDDFFLPPRGHSAESGDAFGSDTSGEEVLPASSGQRPEMLLNS